MLVVVHGLMLIGGQQIQGKVVFERFVHGSFGYRSRMKPLNWTGLKFSAGVDAVVDAADSQFTAADDLLQGVITAGGSVGGIRYRCVVACADNASADKGNLMDIQP